MNRKLSLYILVLFTIFPLNWLREQSAFLRTHFDHWFSSEWMHVIGHLVLFSLLVLLVLHSFQLPLNLNTFTLLICVILVVGGTQELLQLPIKGRAFSWPEVFDLGVDLMGGMMGIIFSLAYRWRKKFYPA